MSAPPHVLYVDDSAPMCELTQLLLEEAGYRVTCAADADAALHALAAPGSQVAAVVADFQMPRCDGPALARRVARAAPGVPVVLTSTCVDEERARMARDAGAVGLVEKSANGSGLLQALAGIVQLPG